MSSIGQIAIVAPYSGDMLPSVARSAIVRNSRPGPKNSTNLPTTPSLRSFSVIVSTRSVAVAPSGRRSTSRKPMTSGMSIEIGCPSIAASASMPPTPQPTTPEAVDHRRVRVGADERIGIRQQAAVGLFLEDDAREVLEIDLVDDAGVGRDDAEVLERVLAPAQERVALAVSGELEPGVEVGGVGLGVVIDLHRVVDDELDRLQAG